MPSVYELNFRTMGNEREFTKIIQRFYKTFLQRLTSEFSMKTCWTQENRRNISPNFWDKNDYKFRILYTQLLFKCECKINIFVDIQRCRTFASHKELIENVHRKKEK